MVIEQSGILMSKDTVSRTCTLQISCTTDMFLVTLLIFTDLPISGKDTLLEDSCLKLPLHVPKDGGVDTLPGSLDVATYCQLLNIQPRNMTR